MKKIITFSLLLISFISFGQVPQGISYQAIALNTAGNPVTSSNVRLRLSVLDASATGTGLYSETHLKTTNTQGLFNLVIGQGTVVSGTFDAINWGTNSKFLKVEMDATGGTTYVAVGTTQLLSVPYAMYAGNTSSVAGNPNINDDIIDNKSSNFAFMDYYDNKAYAFNTISSTWTFQTFNSSATPDLVSTNGNFGFIDYYDNKAYTYNGKTGVWSSQIFNSSASPDFVTSNGSFGFMDYYDNKAYAYNAKTGTWTSQTFNTSASPDLIFTNGNFGFVDYYDSKAYAYNAKTGVWISQTFNSSSSPDLISSNGNFAFIDFYDNKAYIYNGKNGTWSSQIFNTSATPNISISETN